jgi:transposase-like protein
MNKHKTEDYKMSAVKYYLKNSISLEKICEIFDCKKQSLSRWVEHYEKEKSIKRHSRKPVSYKITNEHGTTSGTKLEGRIKKK